MYTRGLGQATATSNCGQSSYADPLTGNTYDACGHLLSAGAAPTPPMQLAAAVTTTTAAPVSPCSIAFFGESSCIGPFGTTTLLLLAALAGLFLMMKGGR